MSNQNSTLAELHSERHRNGLSSINDVTVFGRFLIAPIVTRRHKKSDPLKYDVKKLPPNPPKITFAVWK